MKATQPWLTGSYYRPVLPALVPGGAGAGCDGGGGHAEERVAMGGRVINSY
jgi:hypothetical protein